MAGMTDSEFRKWKDDAETLVTVSSRMLKLVSSEHSFAGRAFHATAAAMHSAVTCTVVAQCLRRTFESKAGIENKKTRTV